MPASDRSYPSVWLRPPREQRSALTRDRIVAEALRILDEEGAEALSMRKLAAALGVGTTSLYWHVANHRQWYPTPLEAGANYVLAWKEWRKSI